MTPVTCLFAARSWVSCTEQHVSTCCCCAYVRVCDVVAISRYIPIGVKSCTLPTALNHVEL